MGWLVGNVVANSVIVEGPNSEILVYSGTPKNGNLIVAIAGSAGSDQFGNQWQSGITIDTVNLGTFLTFTDTSSPFVDAATIFTLFGGLGIYDFFINGQGNGA